MSRITLIIFTFAMTLAFSCRKPPVIPKPIDVDTPVRPGLWKGTTGSESCFVVAEDGITITSTKSSCANNRSFYFSEEGDRGDCHLLASSNSDYAIKNQVVMAKGDSSNINVTIKFVLPERAAVTLFNTDDLCEVWQLDMVWVGE